MIKLILDQNLVTVFFSNTFWRLILTKCITLREKRPYSESFSSVFSRIRTGYGPKKLRIRALTTQCKRSTLRFKQVQSFLKITCFHHQGASCWACMLVDAHHKSHNPSEAHLETSRLSTMELFCENS